VRVVGLTNTPHLNGAEAICEDWDAHVGRWMVRFRKDGTLKRVKPENLEVQEHVEIRVSDTAGEVLYINVSMSWHVSDIKEHISKMWYDCPTTEQRLLLDGRDLEDDEKVGDILASSDDELLCISVVQKPNFTAVETGTGMEGGVDGYLGADGSSQGSSKPDAGAPAPWASFEGHLRATPVLSQATHVPASYHASFLAGKGFGKGIGKCGRFVATTRPGLAAGMRPIH